MHVLTLKGAHFLLRAPELPGVGVGEAVEEALRERALAERLERRSLAAACFSTLSVYSALDVAEEMAADPTEPMEELAMGAAVERPLRTPPAREFGPENPPSRECKPEGVRMPDAASFTDPSVA